MNKIPLFGDGRECCGTSVSHAIHHDWLPSRTMCLQIAKAPRFSALSLIATTSQFSGDDRD